LASRGLGSAVIDRRYREMHFYIFDERRRKRIVAACDFGEERTGRR
jgi:hypothetical protein